MKTVLTAIVALFVVTSCSTTKVSSKEVKVENIKNSDSYRVIFVANKLENNDYLAAIDKNFEASAAEFPNLSSKVSGPVILAYKHSENGTIVETYHPIPNDLNIDKSKFNKLGVKEIPSRKCVFLRYTGSVHETPWDEALELAKEKGIIKPTEQHEVYIDFKGGNSKENIIELQVFGEWK